MPMFKVKVKWGKETFTDLDVNTDEDPVLFKAQLFALTGVAPERQKVMLKGLTLKDNEWGNFKLREGAAILLMGSKEEDVPTEPVHKPVFVEDMDESQLANALDMPSGLTNLGNTCYLNATVQCLKVVPELREALQGFAGSAGNVALEPATSLTASLRDLYSGMEKGKEISPFFLLRVLHMVFPRFAEKSEHGGYQQQDANECWTELLRMLQQKLPAKPAPANGKKYNSIIDQFFGGTFACELKCNESEEEPASKSAEDFLQLSCFISQDVKYLHSGLKSRLQEHITKQSPTLTRDAVYTKTSRISRLPAYLSVQFVRFFFKEREAINAKILKDIKFPLSLDVFELCTPELQQKLTPMRTKFKALEDKNIVEVKDLQNKKDANQAASKTPVKTAPYWFEDDIGSNNSGYYELQAVLTHKGRSSSSGHYVAWIREKGDCWYQMDDDRVSPITSEDVLKLSGGGDWHCAYVLLYGPRLLEIEENDAASTAKEGEAMDAS